MSRKSWQLWLRITIAVLTLVILSYHVGEIEEVSRAISQVQIPLVLLAFVLSFVNLYIQYRKWFYILTLFYPKVGRFEAFASVLGGLTLGFLTPGRVGELGRGLFIDHMNKWHVAGLVLFDKIFNNLAIFFWGGIAFVYLFHYLFDLTVLHVLFLTYALSLVWIFLYVAIHKPQKSVTIFKKWQKKWNFLHRFDSFIEHFVKITEHNLWIIFFYSLLLYGIVFLQFLLLVEAFTIYPILPTVCGIVATMFAKTLLPISVGDLGIREGAAIYFLGRVNVLNVHAFNASLGLFLFNVLFPCLVGIFLIHRLSILHGNVRRS